MVSCSLLISGLDMQNIIKRNKGGSQRLRFTQLPGFANLTASHPDLLSGINDIKQRSKLIM